MSTPEQQARETIDALLGAAGWTIQDIASLNLSASRRVAAREMHSHGGPADYILFVDGKALGIVEAKKEGTTLSAVAEQSARYTAAMKWIPQRWADPLPFTYESTGIETNFRDQRDPDSRSRPVFAFHAPEHLLELVQQPDTLRTRLRQFPALNTAPLRECQIDAVTSLEKSLAANRPRALIQMATGSGKTLTNLITLVRHTVDPRRPRSRRSPNSSKPAASNGSPNTRKWLRLPASALQRIRGRMPLPLPDSPQLRSTGSTSSKTTSPSTAPSPPTIKTPISTLGKASIPVKASHSPSPARPSAAIPRTSSKSSTQLHPRRMSFFKKLFGSGKNPDPSAPTSPPLQKPPAKSADSSASEGEPIKAFDKFGREILISRLDWIDGVLLGQLKKEWNNPDALAGILIQSFSDGFFMEVEEAAKHLRTIDPDPSRGASLLGIVYLQTDRPAEAECVFSTYLKQHGEDGVVLTNLAKAQAALGRLEESEQTLWSALDRDPNQDNGLGWFEVIHREKGGPAAGVDALKRIASIPGSWRARLWLARAALESRNLDAALALYQESLGMAGTPVPTDLLVQMSGDLGNHGHLSEILNLAGPHFDVEIHGIAVGNNLIKASIDTGHLDSARSIIRKLEACQRPDWRDTLGFWENELLKAKLQTQAPVAADKLRMTMLSLNGPLWLIADHGTSRIAAPRAPDTPHVAFLGSSFEAASMPSEVKVQPSDGPGRMSRALPLFLNETVHLHSDARTTTLVPWITNGGGGFGLFGKAPDLAEMAQQARQLAAGGEGAHPPDFLVGTHLVTRGENWKLQLALVRTIDGKTLASHSYDFAEADFRRIADRVTTDLLAALAKDAEVESRTPPAGTQVQDSELDHYLFRLEQTLAVRCGNMDETQPGFLSNPAEILDGMIHLCLQNPGHLPSRILLWRVLDGLKTDEPELVKSMATKVKELQIEHPLAPEFHVLLDQELNTILVA